MQPQNSFELSMVKRACRCDWKLDRCARYEDAAAYVRSIKDMDGVRTPGIEDKSNRERARKLGALLMFAIQTRYERKDFGPPQLKDGPDPFDDAPRDADALATFKEGVEWLIYTWKDVLPYLPCPDGPPIEGIAPEILRRASYRALRLLGVPTGDPIPEQNLHEAGLAEIKRLEGIHVSLSDGADGRVDFDLSLFDAEPDSQLLNRYEVAAERGLHHAINTFMRLRKNPELFPPSDAIKPAPSPASVPAKPQENKPLVLGPRIRNEPDTREALNINYDPVKLHREVKEMNKRRDFESSL